MAVPSDQGGTAMLAVGDEILIRSTVLWIGSGYVQARIEWGSPALRGMGFQAVSVRDTDIEVVFPTKPER